MARTRCGQKLLKAVLFTCLVSHVTRADYKEDSFLRYDIGLDGCQNRVTHGQNWSTGFSALMCQSDDNCSAFQYNEFTGEYQTCDHYKISSLSLNGKSFWVKKTTSQCMTSTTQDAGFTLKKPLQVGTLIYLSFTFVKEDFAQLALRWNSTGEYICEITMVMKPVQYTSINCQNTWYGKYLETPTPLTVGVANVLFVLLTDQDIIVVLNGQKFGAYKYDVLLGRVNYLGTSGPIKIHEFCF